MQDSIEDYIRISRNAKEAPKNTRQELLITAKVKQECEAKALQIVQFAMDGKLRPEALFKCLPFITQQHYQDIVEERSITKLCGYPLCARRIPNMPTKQYYISTKCNKVYDITDRKNYCTNHCYKASIHIKKQIDTTPIWLRQHDKISHFSLLHKSESGLPGEVVDQGVVKPMQESSFTSISSFTEASLDEVEENELNIQEEPPSKTQLKKPKKYQKNPMKTINENDEDDSDGKFNETKKLSKGAAVDCIKETVVSVNTEVEVNLKKTGDEVIVVSEKGAISSTTKSEIVKDNVKVQSVERNSETKKVTNISNRDLPNKLETGQNINAEAQIRKCFKEWITLDTFTFLYGEEVVKSKLTSEKLAKCFESLKIAELQMAHQQKYIEICRKLQLQEMAQDKFDSAVTGSNVLKPVPDFQQIQRENRDFDIKVQSFYLGAYQNIKSNSIKIVEKPQPSDGEAEEPPVFLPLNSVSSRNAQRRKIFLNSLNKTMQVLLQKLRMSPSPILSDVQSLVKTFQLKADNIVFKPIVWNYIAVILLKILYLKGDSIYQKLKEEKSKECMNLYLSTLPSHQVLVDDLIALVSDVDSFIENYIVSEK